MTDEEKVKAVTSKLTGEFFIGQAVRVRNDSGSAFAGCCGTVEELSVTRRCMPLSYIGVNLGEHSGGEVLCFHPDYIEPL